MTRSELELHYHRVFAEFVTRRLLKATRSSAVLKKQKQMRQELEELLLAASLLAEARALEQFALGQAAIRSDGPRPNGPEDLGYGTNKENRS